MPAERKKLLWISISACVFVLIVLAAGFFLLAPKKEGAQAPATVGNSAPPKAQDPQDFLSAPPPAPAPAIEQPRNQDGGVIIVYGDKPSVPPASSGAAAQTAAPQGAGATAQGASAATQASSSGTSPAAPSEGSASAKSATASPAQAAKAPAPAGGKAAKAGAPSAKKSAKKPEASKVDEYWIQAASFTSRGRADELKQLLADKGIAALISVKDISGKSWYRVRVGPYSAKAEADDWMTRLKDVAGCAEAYVSKSVTTKAKL